MPRPIVLFFATGSDALDVDPFNNQILRDVADYMRMHPLVQLELVGRADPRGQPGYNYQLGLDRANAVAQRLLACGVAASRLAVVSRGERDAASAVPASYRQHRSVTIVPVSMVRPTPPQYRAPCSVGSLSRRRGGRAVGGAGEAARRGRHAARHHRREAGETKQLIVQDPRQMGIGSSRSPAAFRQSKVR